jgi:hypothetical protein
MIDYEKIEHYVCDLLTVMGIEKDGEEQSLWLFLHHACCAAAIYEVLDDGVKPMYKELLKKLNHFFSSKISLKERKRRNEKEKIPPHPLIKEKEKKEKEKKIIYTHTAVGETGIVFSDLDQRRKAFKMECWARRNDYDRKMLANFFNYWSDVNPKTHKMRFEEQEYWNIDCRLPRWKSNSHTAADAVADMRLNRTKARQTQEQTAVEQAQEVAAVREQENAEREAKAEESKQTQMLTEDYIREHPDSLMAKIYKNRPTPSPSQGKGSLNTPEKDGIQR